MATRIWWHLLEPYTNSCIKVNDVHHVNYTTAPHNYFLVYQNIREALPPCNCRTMEQGYTTHTEFVPVLQITISIWLGCHNSIDINCCSYLSSISLWWEKEPTKAIFKEWIPLCHTMCVPFTRFKVFPFFQALLKLLKEKLSQPNFFIVNWIKFMEGRVHTFLWKLIQLA